MTCLRSDQRRLQSTLVGTSTLLQRVDGADRRRQLQRGRDPSPVLLRQDVSAAAASVVEGVAMFVQVLRVEIPGVIPVIESVVPVLDASGEHIPELYYMSGTSIWLAL